MELIVPGTTICWECYRGFCLTCLSGGCTCDHRVVVTSETSDGQDNTSTTEQADESGNNEEVTTRSRRNKPDSAVKDQQSTGRKRAAKLYPLDPSKPCEWREKVKCGGGDHPILGCENGVQQARHHGPDKNTLNNEEGNVHRICHTCHNRWHAANDSDYDPNKPLKD